MKLGDTVELRVKAKLICDPAGTVGCKFYMKYDGGIAQICDPETGQELGMVAGCLGGGVEVQDGTNNDCIWYISPQDLWEAYSKAIKKQEK